MRVDIIKLSEIFSLANIGVVRFFKFESFLKILFKE